MPRFHRRRQPLALIVVAALLVGGCAVGPVYQAPLPTVAATWAAAVPSSGGELVADWWTGFDDPAVATLVRWAEADNPTVDKAVAQIAIARATLASSQAAMAPTLDGSGSLLRSRGANAAAGAGPGQSTLTTRSAGFDSSWEIDLFGQRRHARDAAAARVTARGDDLAAARLTLGAEVADTYVQYRVCRLIEAWYAEQSQSLQDTARITASAVRAGFNAPADDDLAQAGAANASATLIQQQTSCEVLVKSLVALTGAAEPVLRQAIDGRRDGVPAPTLFDVTSVPAQWLRQRPDIAAAERTLAAASADIGSAEAARYPSLSLGGSISVAAASGTSSLTSWSFGPSLTLPIFDGGNRRAAVASAEATRDAAFADYSSTVRTAVQEVEQALTQLYGAARRSDDAARAAARYRRYFDASVLNWRAGGIDLLSLEEARRNAITAETTWVTLQGERVRQYIALYKALGGGWQAEAAVATNTKGQP